MRRHLKKRRLDPLAREREKSLCKIWRSDVVVKRGDDGSIVEMVRRFRGTGLIVRFIEYMDVGKTNGWRMEDGVPAREIAGSIAAHWPIEPVQANYFGEVAERWRYVDGAGEIDIISSVTRTFCGSCTRARLSADGKLYLCLFAGTGHDLRGILRGGADDETIAAAIRSRWHGRDDRYSEIRAEATPIEKVEMSHIGGRPARPAALVAQGSDIRSESRPQDAKS